MEESHIKIFKQLMTYIEQGDCTNIEHVLQNEKNHKEIVNMKSPEESYLLHKAAQLNQHYILQILLNFGALIDVKSSSSSTALHWAASSGNLESCEVLLNYGANILSRDENQHSPLHLCFLRKHPFYKCAQLFLLFKADTNYKGNNGSTCLHICAQEGNVTGVKWLLKKETTKINCKDNSGQTPLMRAITTERFYESKESVSPLEMVKYLLSCGADYKVFDEHSRNILFKGVLTGRTDILQFFKNYLDPNEYYSMLNSRDLEGKTLLHFAVIKNDLKTVRYLLSQNLDFNIMDNSKVTPLNYAIKYGFMDIEAELRMDTTLDDKIQSLSVFKITKLNLSQEKEKLNKKNINSIFKWSTLTSLNLSTHSTVTIIPNYIPLKELILSDCHLKDIPQGIEYLINLTELNLSNNNINLLSQKFSRLESLTYLNLSNNQLYDWPRDINSIQSLKYLNLSHNNLSFEQNNDIYNLVSPRGFSKNNTSYSFFKKKEPEKIEPSNLTIRVTADGRNLKDSKPLDLKKGDSFFKQTLSFFTKKEPEFKSPKEKPISPTPISPREKSPRSPRGDQNGSFLKTTLSFFSKQDKTLNFDTIEEVRSPREEFCPSLTYLNLSANEIKEIPREMCEFEKLIEFDLSKNSLKSLPQYFLMLRTLKKLNISNCKFTSFPSILLDLKGLSELDLSNNSLEKIISLGKLTNLKILNISCCFLKSLPDKFLENTNLTKLIGIDNQITELNGIGIDPLEYIDFTDNNIETVQNIHQAKNLNYINLSRNNLTIISSDLCKLKLKTLILSGNHIKILPLEFPHLKDIRVLDLSYNNLKEFSGVDNFSQIENLNIQFNEIRSFKISKNLQFLSQLNVSQNYISEFKGFCHCSNLQSVNASENLIQEIDPQLYHAKRLVSLDFSNNEISSIPLNIEKHLYFLQTFKLNDNNVYELSTDLQDWVKLNGINFEYNSQPPILISEGIYLSTTGACNNKKLLDLYNIKSVLWLVRKQSPRLHYPDDFHHEIVYFDPQKDNMTNTFIYCKNFSSQSICVFASDGGYNIAGVFIIAMLILCKNLALNQAMKQVLNIKKFEISEEYMLALQKLEKEKTKKSDIKIILENLTEREQFRLFCQEKKMDKYVNIWENVESAYINSLDKSEKSLFSQEIVDEAISEKGGNNLKIPTDIICKILEKIKNEEFEKDLFDEMILFIEKQLEPLVPEFRKSTLVKPIKIDKLSMFSSRKNKEEKKLNEKVVVKPKSQPETPRSDMSMLSPKQTNSAPITSKGDTSPYTTPRDHSKEEPKQIKFQIPKKDLKREPSVDYDSIFDVIKVTEIPSPRGSSDKLKNLLPKLDFSGVKK